MSTFRIIVFDGGGIRGALSTRILKRIYNKYPDILKYTNLFAGTSTGALIALALASGKDGNYVDNLYNYETVKSIFYPSHLNLFRPKFNNKNLREVILSVFTEDLTLGDLEKYVFIPSFNVKGFSSDNWQSVFFNNLSRGSTYTSKVVDVALASSAAPTYFPSYKNFIDGGVIVNNPTAASMISVMKLLKPKHSLSDFRILSIGTGSTLNQIKSDTSSWGALQWMLRPKCNVKTPLVSILLNDTPLEDLYCKELIGPNYFRINPILKYKIPLDDYSKVPLLKDAVDNLDLSDTFKFIENHFLH
ncbi:patatin-like phospholipase family protein [Clostridium sp. UBA4395]|uniref:patatin-like phospholipase family protein n=1 Tax=Clostridium sp. UBA4395 TaxID=1946360 RepID=UPI000E9D5CCE|nr:patatin [Clostridium sp.]